jgi:Icc-related predicted phosphoesterase
MKQIDVICISDTHSYHERVTIKPCDILIHAGDYTGNDIGRAELRRFLQWIKRQPAKHIAFIAGNHDGAFDKWYDRAVDMVSEVAPNVTYLQDSGCEFMGLKLWGTPWTPRFMDWHFNADPGEDILNHYRKIPSNTDILISHGPPFGWLDKSNNRNNETGRKFDDCLGSRDLRDEIYRVMPMLSVFGHIHGSHGMSCMVHDDGYKTIVVNATQVDEDYIPYNRPILVKLDAPYFAPEKMAA